MIICLGTVCNIYEATGYLIRSIIIRIDYELRDEFINDATSIAQYLHFSLVNSEPFIMSRKLPKADVRHVLYRSSDALLLL
jgi:hypothetical protein